METRRLPDLPLWSRWNQKALQDQAKKIGPRAFARGYFLQAYTDEDRMFRNFQSCYSPGLRAAEVIARRYKTFVGVDLAGKKRKGTALVALALEPGTQRRIPVDIRIGAFSYNDTAGHLADMNRMHNLAYVMIENNALQEAVVDAITTSEKSKGSDLWMKIEPFHTGKNKSDETIGLPSLETEFANRAWAIPSDEFEKHPPGHDCNWCTWKDQMINYPMWSAQDGCMAAWFAREALSRWGNLTGGPGISGLNVR